MRKIQRAAVVAAMIGSVGMAAAGVASAQGGGPAVTVSCTQDFGDTTATTADVPGTATGAITSTGSILPGSNGNSTTDQPRCGTGNVGGNVTSGNATGGATSFTAAVD